MGLGDGENFLASAVQALVGYTRKFLVVENGEIISLTGNSVEITDLDGELVEREPFRIDWSADAVELGGFEDCMLKEIHEQPAAARATLADRLDPNGKVELPELDLAGVERVTIVACGTAYYAALLGRYDIERFARIPVDVTVASEYRYADPLVDEITPVVALPERGDDGHPGGTRDR